MIGTAVIDAEQALEGFDFTTAERWHVLVLCDSTPAVRVELPSPGRTRTNALAEAALVRRADPERARRALIERLRQRLAEATAPEHRLDARISVVVCTHRRPQYLPDLLGALAVLSPRPFETIIVDNDPGDRDCRSEVERAGFRYLREDRRGLDNARNAGLRAAEGDIVVFTDDDCVPAPKWLGSVARAFREDGVAAVTGPAFPYLLDTPSRVRMERQASLARGLRRTRFDWRSLSPLHASAVGVGANLAVRRTVVLDLGNEPFPPELDAGTATESGGDTYVLARLLAQGCRLVYEPDMFLFHQHRADGQALHRAVLGYGTGLSAALTKLLVEERELAAPRAWAWLIKQYLRTQGRRALGRADAIDARLSWDYLHGGFLGTRRWLRSRGDQGSLARGVAAVSTGCTQPGEMDRTNGAGLTDRRPWRSEPGGRGAREHVGGLRISVVIPTCRRPESLKRCLQALSAQDCHPDSFEVIVVDDDPRAAQRPSMADHAEGGQADAWPFSLRRTNSDGRGAAAARNLGALAARAPLLLFLDDDLVADPWLILSHVGWHERHAGERVAMVGHYRPRPLSENLASANARLWWQEMFALLEAASRPTFVGALTANLSLSQSLFRQLDGGFDEQMGRERREDWEWGLRALHGGIRLAFEPSASARHEFTLTTTARLRDARREGAGDVLLATRFPESRASLPILNHRPAGRGEPLRWLAFRAWDLAPIRGAVVATLGLLESCRLRQAWSRLFKLAQALAYAQGTRAMGWSTGLVREATTIDVELLSEDPIPAPAVAAPMLRLTLAGKRVASLIPREGLWGPALAEQIADALRFEDIERAAHAGGWLPEPARRLVPWDQVEVLFGPQGACSRELDQRAAFEELGATVNVIDPGHARATATAEHWRLLASAACAGERPLIAFPFPGTAPTPVWLEQALVAFDGERVGVAFGGALASLEPLCPLYLHARDSPAIPMLTLTDSAPAYLLLRRELARALSGAEDAPDAWVRVLDQALRDGWVVARRNVHGLGSSHYGMETRGRAFARSRVRRARRLSGVARNRVSGAALCRDGLALAWRLRQRPRMSLVDLSSLLRGILLGAAEAMRKGGENA